MELVKSNHWICIYNLLPFGVSLILDGFHSQLTSTNVKVSITD